MLNKTNIRLSGWKRLGIVLSVLWILGAWVKLDNDIGIWADKSAKTIYGLCMGNAKTGPDFDKCWQDQIDDKRKFRSDWSQPVDKVLTLVIYFIAPITMSWLFVYVCIWTFKWVRAGFKK